MSWGMANSNVNSARTAYKPKGRAKENFYGAFTKG